MSTKRNIASGVITTIRLPQDQYDTLRQMAASQHRSLSGELRMAIEAHIEAHRDESDEAVA